MITILFGIFALIIVGAAVTFAYIVFGETRTESAPASKHSKVT